MHGETGQPDEMASGGDLQRASHAELRDGTEVTLNISEEGWERMLCDR